MVDSSRYLWGIFLVNFPREMVCCGILNKTFNGSPEETNGRVLGGFNECMHCTFMNKNKTSTFTGHGFTIYTILALQ